MSTTTETIAARDRVLNTLQRKLDAIALEQLRAEVVMLRERLDLAEDRADKAEAEAMRAWECADEWRDDAMSMQLQLCDILKAQPGITQNGELVVVKK
jgi:hypothetical protein